jgi:AcrR family transcriptional regulator
MSPRPQIDHIRRPQILEAAASVIADRGIGATRIADIAERAGTSGPALLYWFESKDELLGEALGFAEQGFYDALTGRLLLLDRPAERLRLLIEASVYDYDWTLWMELWTRALRDERTAETRRRLDERWRNEIEREIAAGQAVGEFAEHDPPERVAAILASLLDGLAVQATLGDPGFPPDRIRELTVEIAERLLEAELPELDEEILKGLSEPRLLAGGERG